MTTIHLPVPHRVCADTGGTLSMSTTGKVRYIRDSFSYTNTFNVREADGVHGGVELETNGAPRVVRQHCLQQHAAIARADVHERLTAAQPRQVQHGAHHTVRRALRPRHDLSVLADASSTASQHLCVAGARLIDRG
jgi:hypothetical protein